MTDPRDSTDTTFKSGPTFGQWLGGVLLVANLALLFVDAIVLKEQVGTSDVILHGIGFGAAMYFVYPNRFLAFVNAIKDKIPTLGGGGA